MCIYKNIWCAQIPMMRRMVLCCLFQVAQTRPRGGPRSQIAIPAQGMIEFRDALTDLLDEFGTDDHGESEDGKYSIVSMCSCKTENHAIIS